METMQMSLKNIQKTPLREFFVGVASYLKENKISSLVLVFVHSLTLSYAPIIPGQALGTPVSHCCFSPHPSPFLANPPHKADGGLIIQPCFWPKPKNTNSHYSNNNISTFDKRNKRFFPTKTSLFAFEFIECFYTKRIK